MKKLHNADRILASAVLLFGLASAETAMSAVVWTQSPLTGADVTNLDITFYAVANDFELDESESLTGFTVFLADRAQSSLTDAIPDGVLDNFSGTLGWAVYSDAGNTPGALLLSGNDASPHILSSGLLSGTREMFEVNGSFGSMIDLPAGTYWLSIRDGQWGSAGDGTIVGWVPSTQLELSPLVFEQNPQQPANWQTAGLDPENPGFDLAMTIHAVPEPSTVMLFAGAFALTLQRRIRR